MPRATAESEVTQTPAGKADCRAFQRAIALHTVDPHGSAEPIAIMMRLACEGVKPITRRWAAKWLAERCNIVLTDEHQGIDHATPAAAANFH